MFKFIYIFGIFSIFVLISARLEENIEMDEFPMPYPPNVPEMLPKPPGHVMRIAKASKGVANSDSLEGSESRWNVQRQGWGGNRYPYDRSKIFYFILFLKV